jgi:hypothetical protein
MPSKKSSEKKAATSSRSEHSRPGQKQKEASSAAKRSSTKPGKKLAAPKKDSKKEAMPAEQTAGPVKRAIKKVARVISVSGSAKKAPGKSTSEKASTSPRRTIAATKSSAASSGAAKRQSATGPQKSRKSVSRKATAENAGVTVGTSVLDEEEIRPTSPTDIREHFFHEHRGPVPYPEERELPDEYGDTKITVLVRDPEWIYLYWEVNDATRDELKIPRTGHNKRTVVRIYQVAGRAWPSENANYFFDVDVSPYASNWYVKLPETNKSWCGELGIFDETGAYIPICRSNVISTPRDSMSDEVDSEWMSVEESFQRLFEASGGYELQQGRDFRGSETILRQLQKQVAGLLRAGALTSGSLSSAGVTGISPGKDKGFWLQVHTELVLFGATEPDARVTVQGRPVKLNADGTFSLRFSLPDGEQSLPVRAQNRDGDLEKSVTPVVRKSTKSS